MNTALTILFSVIFSLLLVHEMDAVRNREWKMFIVLKDMQDKTAYRIFTALHIPLYGLIVGLLLFAETRPLAFYVLDTFLIIHALLHWFFERHPYNTLKSAFSRFLIYTMGVLATVHIILLSTLG